jgi:hypothetical protein
MSKRSSARLSLYYLATYLGLTGLALMISPQASLRLLLSTGTYDDIFVQFLGSFMVALSIIVTQIIRLKLAVLYPTTVVVRIFFITVIIGLYLKSHDPLFLMILGVVSLGLFLTLAGLILDLRNSKKRGI